MGAPSSYALTGRLPRRAQTKFHVVTAGIETATGDAEYVGP